MSDAKRSPRDESGIGEHGVDPDAAFDEPARFPITPFPIDWLLTASGLYEWKLTLQLDPTPIPVPGPFPLPGQAGSPEQEAPAEAQIAPLLPWWLQREDLRLDVDGRYPQMKVSGTLYNGAALRVHWIANLAKSGSVYTGHIWYKDGTVAALPFTNVTVQVTKSFFANQRKVTVTFTGGGAATRVRTYRWKSAYFHPVELEYDRVQGTTTVTQIDTGAHPNRPAGLPAENLTIETVFRRAGFHVTRGSDSVIPISAAGANATWSDMEMHDAMQVYWSRFADKPQWAMWVLFAALHDQGSSLGGIMFDDIGPNHRQGTAVFNDSFIKNPPAGDPNPAAWVQRMKFWTACHEMGHSFNLAHSWQKSLVFQGKGPWIPLANEAEARSFMNYPFFVAGGQGSFFSDFEFRFSDGELLFMRHAPERMVRMGDAAWFDDHGFRGAEVAAAGAATFELELRVHRDLDHFEFMEPVVVELKLTNASPQPQIVDENLLRRTDEMTVIIQQRGKPARQWRPLAQHCYSAVPRTLAPGESLYESLQVATSPSGWEISDPGVYTIQVALHQPDGDLVSNPLEVRVAPPRSYDEEYLAQDVFSEDVGRTLALNGSRFLEGANQTLREVAERFPERRVAHHAHLALGNPLTRDYKLLVVDDDPQAAASDEADKRIKVLSSRPEAAREELGEALTARPSEAAETLGHIEYRQMVEQYSAFLADAGDPGAAASSISVAKETLAARNVLDSVVEDLDTQLDRYRSAEGKTKSKGKGKSKAGGGSSRKAKSK